jgi:hypothetical protein
MCSSGGLSIVYEPPPFPPAGWESRVTPGFEPSLESVIISVSERRPLPERAVWDGWGPRASEALFTLYCQEPWVLFRPFITRILLTDPSGQGKGFLKARMEKLLTEGDLKANEEEFRCLLYAIGPLLGDEAVPLARESLHALSAKQECSSEEIGRARREVSVLQIARSRTADDFLEQLAKRGNESLRQICINALGGVRAAVSVECARKLLAETGDSAMKTRLEAHIEQYEPYARAQEPMSRILEQEQGKGRR